MRLFRIALSAAALAGLGFAAHAEGRFIHPADTSKDDRIDKTEWVAYGLPADDFAKADKNGDKKIDGPEFVAWNNARQATPAG